MKTKDLVLIPLLAATLTVGKTALAFLPNVEIVTLLLALYGYLFKWRGVAAAYIFVIVEMFIWGVAPWVISYFLYWPLVAAVFWVLVKAGVKNRFVLSGTAVVLTIFFGVLTSFVDIGLFSLNFDKFFYRFSVYYLRGISFYLTQIICNAVLFVLTFPVLSKFLRKVSKKTNLNL